MIQLSLKDLLGLMKANPNNDTTHTVWSEEDDGLALRKAKSEQGIIYTLAKVCLFTIVKDLYTNNINRFEALQFM